jgi:hypothetical protein
MIEIALINPHPAVVIAAVQMSYQYAYNLALSSGVISS